MRKIHIVLALSALISAQTIYAKGEDSTMPQESKPCKKIANACVKAGYTRGSSEHTRFWHDCMKPVIMGQTVKGVKIDSDTATTCRTDKIAELKKELQDFENGSQTSVN